MTLPGDIKQDPQLLESKLSTPSAPSTETKAQTAAAYESEGGSSKPQEHAQLLKEEQAKQAQVQSVASNQVTDGGQQKVPGRGKRPRECPDVMIRLGWAVALIMLAAEIHLMLAYFIRSRSLPGAELMFKPLFLFQNTLESWRATAPKNVQAWQMKTDVDILPHPECDLRRMQLVVGEVISKDGIDHFQMEICHFTLPLKHAKDWAAVVYTAEQVATLNISETWRITEPYGIDWRTFPSWESRYSSWAREGQVFSGTVVAGDGRKYLKVVEERFLPFTTGVEVLSSSYGTKQTWRVIHSEPVRFRSAPANSAVVDTAATPNTTYTGTVVYGDSHREYLALDDGLFLPLKLLSDSLACEVIGGAAHTMPSDRTDKDGEDTQDSLLIIEATYTHAC